MMRFDGSDASLFEMTVLGYQFPEIQTDEYDSNWLRIWIHVVHPRAEWTSIDACLLTFEVESLASWFDGIARGKQVEQAQDFIEPNLCFRLIDNAGIGKLLAILFESSSRPRWARSDTVPAGDLSVQFPVEELDFSQAAVELRQELDRYPQRSHR